MWQKSSFVIQEVLKSSFRKFYGRYGDLIQQYEVSLSRMSNDILTLDQLQWLPNRSYFPPISWPWYQAWLSPTYEWFSCSICNGCGMPAGNAYHSGHLVQSPFWGLAYAPIVETRFPVLVVVHSRLFTLNTPRYFLDFALLRVFWENYVRKSLGKRSSCFCNVITLLLTTSVTNKRKIGVKGNL